jgi:outer membrane protein assembly factor BamB
VVQCFDRETGTLRWEDVACEALPHEGVHPTNGYASASPVTDGERLFVSFGSRGVFCYDLEGNRIWERDLGRMRTRYGWGEGSSPALHGGTLVVQWDHEEQSALYALDAASGAVRWRVLRDEPSSWSTPGIVAHGGVTQVVTTGLRARGYDLATGQLLWECDGLTLNAIPSPVTRDGVAICMSGFRGNAVLAIDLDARGDLTGTDAVLWSRDRGAPYVPSPLVLDGLLYYSESNGAILHCIDLESAEDRFPPRRLPHVVNLYASPVGAAGRLYFADREGAVLVLRGGPDPEVLATAELDDEFDASPAIAGNELFLRGRRLWCFAED